MGKIRFIFEGVVECHKAHLVAKGFSQRECINYTKIFSPVAKKNVVQLILYLDACFGWNIHQMDVKSVILHGDLYEEIYMEQTLSFVKGSTLVCQLKKLLYGFKCCESNHSLYVLHVHGDNLIVVIYVDDLVITGNNLDLILRLKTQLAATFEMTDLGILHYFLGLQVLPLPNGVFIFQSKYLLDLLKHCKMDDCKPCATPL